MSHELTQRTNGMTEMAYLAGTSRWHGLGNELKEDATIEEWTVAAGMDWKVQRSRVRYETDATGTAPQVWDDQHVLFRSDNKKPLGLVSDGFKIVQPRECLEFFRDLCETNGFKLRTAGTLFEGRRFWALADIGEESIILDPRDKVKARTLMFTACDGSAKTTVKFVNECVVCNNTLTSARAEDGKQVAVSHRSVWNPDDAKVKLGIANGTFSEFIRQSREFARTTFTPKVADMFTLRLVEGMDLDTTMTTAEVEETRASRAYKKIIGLFNGQAMGSNLKGRTGTAWAWLNAVTEYADHHAPARNDDNRFNSSQFGIGDKMKNSALALLQAA
jgi:phage/plasmid-like protein (TIGR03299 family)